MKSVGIVVILRLVKVIRKKLALVDGDSFKSSKIFAAKTNLPSARQIEHVLLLVTKKVLLNCTLLVG